MLPHLRSTSTTPPEGQQQRQVPFPHRFTRAEVENNKDTRMVLGVVAPSDGQYNTMSRKAFTKDNTCAGSGTAADITTGGNKSSYAITNPPYMYHESDPRSSQPDYNVSRSGGSHHHHKHASSSSYTVNGQQMPHKHSSVNVGASAPSGYTTESRSMLSKPPVDVYQELKKRPPAEVNRQNRLANNTANFVFSFVDGQVDPLAEKKHLAGRHTSMAKSTPSSTYSQEHHMSPAPTSNNVSSTGAAPGGGLVAPASTVRSDYCHWDNKDVKILRDEAAACRAKQQQTNYRLGIDTSVWASEARNYGSTAMGNRNSILQAQQNRAMAKHQKHASQFTLGSSDMVDKDLPTVEHVSPEGKVEMRRQMITLKQMDFKPFTVDPSEFRNKSNVAAQDDRFVLGHRGVKKIESVYRSSFTPTEFV